MLLRLIYPELILTAVACGLFLLGVSGRAEVRRAAAWIAATTLAVLCFLLLTRPPSGADDSFQVFAFAQYVKVIAAGVGVLLILLAFPTNRQATGNSALDFGHDAGEFFGLALLSIAGVFLVASANDIILLFLGLELASIPTYIMVSISRPLPVAQEAGVKYFFLGAMSAALMLFGFSYLYGVSGSLRLDRIGEVLQQTIAADPQRRLGDWQLLGVLMLLAGLAFKIAAVPLHFYAADVYHGAATPVTALLSFVPKTSGFVAIIKLLHAVGGGGWVVPEPLVTLLWVMAVLTMTVGNVLGLLQFNVKRLLAYSSIAHSGYMLVALTALAGAHQTVVEPRQAVVQDSALSAVLFYLAAYGLMNVGAFGVLMLLPSRRGPDPLHHPRLATSAETFEDLAGTGRRHVALGLAMAACCFGLIGLPLTVGFIGKVYLIKPALDAHFYWLVVLAVINAAISAAYYLRIVAAMFLRAEPQGQPEAATPELSTPLKWAIGLSVLATIGLGTFLPATRWLTDIAARVSSP